MLDTGPRSRTDVRRKSSIQTTRRLDETNQGLEILGNVGVMRVRKQARVVRRGVGFQGRKDLGEVFGAKADN